MSFKCLDCPRVFRDWHARYQHCNATDHSPLNYECRCCDEIWSTSELRRDHEAKEHNYCSDCDRTFNNANNLKMHLNSRKHRGTGIKCPFCKTGFVSATGLAHHLEGGRCSAASSLNRDMVYRAVRMKDPDGVLAKKLIGWHGSSTYEATGSAWNGDAWECYLCHRNFVSMNVLNGHLNSPAHQQALYHCPNRHACGRDFKTLAAVMNHLESESCGYSRFEAVQNTVTQIVSGDRRLTFTV
ncbi:hypothetical protein F4805DRAFT_235423 [Annulohypoxylon moriforme]|nr:hypothetical protein F4805DRAFT_235423 [Annulohypoxylon moriforme]